MTIIPADTPDISQLNPQLFQQAVLSWYKKSGRKDLPWQKNRSPYRVWLSEIMLQQTQVNTVIPYFERFTHRFPDMITLSKAPQDEVLALWSGLGYYARARNLHKTARQAVEHYKGELPQDHELLNALPGIGRSTAGAILSLSMNQSSPILDGNVKRVLSRTHCIEGWYGTRRVEQALWTLSSHYTPKRQFRQYNQAMMDIGATICTRSKPRCQHCPLQAQCQALTQARTAELPHPKPKKKLPEKQCQLLVIRNNENEVLLERRPDKGIWGGLWCLPQIPEDLAAETFCLQQMGLKTQQVAVSPQFRHTFSHFHLHINPVTLKLMEVPRNIAENNQQRWVRMSQLESLGLATPVAKILRQTTLEAKTNTDNPSLILSTP